MNATERKVIPMWRPRTFTSAEKMLEEVRVHIHKYKGSQNELADAVGVARSTISNIAIGNTRWPRHTTLFPLLDALGLRMQLIEKDQPGDGRQTKSA